MPTITGVEPSTNSTLKRKRQTVLEAFQKYKSGMQENENYSSKNMITPKKLVANVSGSVSLKSIFSTTKNNPINNSEFMKPEKTGYETSKRLRNKTMSVSVSPPSKAKASTRTTRNKNSKVNDTPPQINDNVGGKNLIEVLDSQPNPFSESYVANPFDKANKLGIIGRKEERDEIKSHIDKLIFQKTGGGLYISGNPGTGKSACTLNVIESNIDSIYGNNAYVIVINCMVISSVKQLYDCTLSNLTKQKALKKKKAFNPIESQMYRASSTEMIVSTQTEYNTKSKLEKIFVQTKKDEGYIIVFDELDNLINLNLNVIYTFFEWAMSENSNLLLVGIANALDLTERLLPRLKARNCIPNLLHFKPYSVDNILNVLKYRSVFLKNNQDLKSQLLLKSDASQDQDSIIEKFATIRDPALELCARKVAASSGDMRKALDVCRSVVDSSLSANPPKFAPNATSANQRINLTKVPLPEMIKALSGMDGSSTQKMLLNLNFHQKIVLVTLLKFKNSLIHDTSRLDQLSNLKTRKQQQTMINSLKRNQTLAINTLYKMYSTACEDLKMVNILARSEFNDLISMMESIGVLAIKPHKFNFKQIPRNQNTSTLVSSTKSNVFSGENCVLLAISGKDVQKVIADLPILSNIL